MKEINKRIFTSIVLIAIFLFSILVKEIFFITLVLILFQCFYEFYFILNKIFSHKKKFIFFLSLFFILLSLSIIVFKIFILYTGEINEDKIILLLIILICILSDIGGFLFGKYFKGKKITKISPNKTYSGSIGSFTLSLVVIYFLFNNYISTGQLLIYTIIISLASQIGDIIISYLKRKAKLKDTGNILPGHGGFLDRFDGMIFALPIGIIITNII